MSKIGDLIVRMQLKYQDYQKGLKQAEKETKGFASSLGKIKGIGIAVWGAIGASVTAMAKTFVQHSQTMSDKWAVGVSQMKAVWNQFLTSLTSWDWEGFGQRISDAMSAAAASTAAHDAEFEVQNSIKLRKAAMADELAQLQILMRDTGKSYAERAKAAEEYLKKVKPLYDAEIDLRRQIYLADTDEYLKNAGLQANTANRDYLRTFLTDIAPNGNLVAILNEYQKKVQGKRNYKLSAQDLKAVDEFYEKYGYKGGAALSVLAQYYQSTNDEVAKKVVDAIARYDSSIAAFNEETRKVQTVQNTALAQMAKSSEDGGEGLTALLARAMAEIEAETERSIKALDDALDIEIEGPEIDLSSLEWADEYIKQFVENWEAEQAEIARLNQMLENSIVQAASGGMQALTDMMMGIEGADASQVLAALLQPFASTMTQLGEMLIAQGIAIEVFKSSLKDLNGVKAIAAGTALLAIGAALTSGIKKLGSSAGSSGATASSSAVSSSAVSNQEYKSEQTIYIKGKISGSDIVVAGDNQKNKWRK